MVMGGYVQGQSPVTSRRMTLARAFENHVRAKCNKRVVPQTISASSDEHEQLRARCSVDKALGRTPFADRVEQDGGRVVRDHPQPRHRCSESGRRGLCAQVAPPNSN